MLYVVTICPPLSLCDMQGDVDVTFDPNNQNSHVVLGENSTGYTADGEIISSQTVSSKTRTVETITVKT